MRILYIVKREAKPESWGAYPELPWNEPEFSKRMLKEHLSQAHNAASRRTEIIDHHVQWIHEQILSGTASNVLDITCGPGLYTHRLARLGHRCRGIDFSPASIDYAKRQAANDALSCEYVLGDIVTTDYGKNYDLVTMLFGQFNTFSPANVRCILEKAYDALCEGGILLLEPHTYEAVKATGNSHAAWFTDEDSVYAVTPQLVLREQAWHEELSASTERYFIIDAESSRVDCFVISMQAYTRDAFRDLLESLGFSQITFYEQFGSDPIAADDDFIAVTAMKA